MNVMVYDIATIKEKTVPIARSHGVARMSLFGSYARGEADENSDVDLLIERGNLRGMIKYFSFVYELEDELGCHVDVVTTGISDREFLANIEREGVLLYEE